MKLLFTKVIQDGLSQKKVLKAVDVMIPLDASWKLVGSCDSIEISNPVVDENLETVYNKAVPRGTSKLVRKGSVIKIVKRKNDNMTPDAICIDNDVRENFFHDSKYSVTFEETGKYQLNKKLDAEVYDYWFKYMEVAYNNFIGD